MARHPAGAFPVGVHTVPLAAAEGDRSTFSANELVADAALVGRKMDQSPAGA